jgi:hypothetical protein
VTGATEIPSTYASLVAVYVALAGAVLWMLRRLARVPLDVRDASKAAAPDATRGDAPPSELDGAR